MQTEDERRSAFQTDLENIMNKHGFQLQRFISIDPNIDSATNVFIQSLANMGRIASQINFTPIPNWQPPKPPDPITTPDERKAIPPANNPVPPDSSEMDEWRVKQGKFTAVPLDKSGKPLDIDSIGNEGK